MGRFRLNLCDIWKLVSRTCTSLWWLTWVDPCDLIQPYAMQYIYIYMWVATGRLITLAAFWNGSLAKTTLRTIEKPNCRQMVERNKMTPTGMAEKWHPKNHEVSLDLMYPGQQTWHWKMRVFFLNPVLHGWFPSMWACPSSGIWAFGAHRGLTENTMLNHGFLWWTSYDFSWFRYCI